MALLDVHSIRSSEDSLRAVAARAGHRSGGLFGSSLGACGNLGCDRSATCREWAEEGMW